MSSHPLSVLRLLLALGCACTAPDSSATRLQRPDGTGPQTAAESATPSSASWGFARATAFLPADYECELLVDYGLMRELGLLDQLERVPGMADFLDALGQTYFTELDQIDRARTAMVFDRSGSRATNRSVSVAEGRDLGPPTELPAGAVRVDIGDWQAVQVDVGFSSRPTAVWPSSSLVVVGGHDLLVPVLRGERPGGVPHSDLLPLTVGNGILMQGAICGLHEPGSTPFGDVLFVLTLPCREASRDLAGGRLRLSVDDEENISLSTTLRFVQGSDRMAEFAGAWRDQLAAWAADAPAAARKVIRDVSVSQDGRDVQIEVELGPLRRAVAKVQSLVLAIMASR